MMTLTFVMFSSFIVYVFYVLNDPVERALMLNEKHHKGMELGDLRSWQEDKFYQLDRPNMGHCYIINNVDREQPATRRDVDQLEKTFSGLGIIGVLSWYY